MLSYNNETKKSIFSLSFYIFCLRFVKYFYINKLYKPETRRNQKRNISLSTYKILNLLFKT